MAAATGACLRIVHATGSEIAAKWAMRNTLDGARRVYSRVAAVYDARWKRYLARTIDRTAAAVPSSAGGRLLDVGCGSGILIQRLLSRNPRLDATGVDVSREMLDIAGARLGGRVNLVLADSAALPFGAGVFDLATSTSSLHHWQDPVAGLREIARVLNPGGTLVLTDWRADHLPTRLCDLVLRLTDPSHRGAATMRQARAMLESAGFHVDCADSYSVGWRWGLMTITARSSPADVPDSLS